MVIVTESAKACLRELVGHVFSCQGSLLSSLTYQELAYKIGRLNKHGVGHAHGMGGILGTVGNMLRMLEKKWGIEVPHLQSLVVLKTGTGCGLPDIGIKEFWTDYPTLTRDEKQSKVIAEYVKIRNFGLQWERVLQYFNIEPTNSIFSKKRHRNGSSGESIHHKRLKEFIVEHPYVIGVISTNKFHIEYVFPSLDAVDILFVTNSKCIAVEVKSKASEFNFLDYKRGIYQIIKYRALLSAVVKAENLELPTDIECVLVLEKKLPAEYKVLAEELDVTVIEDVRSRLRRM